ncbi:MAG: DUF2905 domain-containing protein [Candidatus Hinthialibacter antarcticus]|nr:DUF2905 domain-containing protein [Candidatus Hinthialibacter antarcticus]
MEPGISASIGKSLVLFGVVLIALGLAVWFGPKVPFLGKLPGDIYMENKSGNVSFYFPVVTCIVISVILTIVLNLFSGGSK